MCFVVSHKTQKRKEKWRRLEEVGSQTVTAPFLRCAKEQDNVAENERERKREREVLWAQCMHACLTAFFHFFSSFFLPPSLSLAQFLPFALAVVSVWLVDWVRVPRQTKCSGGNGVGYSSRSLRRFFPFPIIGVSL